MSEKLSPLALQFCIVFSVSKEPWRALDQSYDSPAGQEIKAWMVDEGLIEDGENGTTWGSPTDRLHAFVDHLCSVPLPVSVTQTIWISPQSHGDEP